MFEKAGAGDFTEAMNITTQLVFIRDGLMGWSCAIRWGDTLPPSHSYPHPGGCVCEGEGVDGVGGCEGGGNKDNSARQALHTIASVSSCSSHSYTPILLRSLSGQPFTMVTDIKKNNKSVDKM